MSSSSMFIFRCLSLYYSCLSFCLSVCRIYESVKYVRLSGMSVCRQAYMSEVCQSSKSCLSIKYANQLGMFVYRRESSVEYKYAWLPLMSVSQVGPCMEYRYCMSALENVRLASVVVRYVCLFNMFVSPVCFSVKYVCKSIMCVCLLFFSVH
jgi:hypothetical protein